ncbi:MAG: hypothetical protein JW775_11190 [Candidatus Aminicenantes bacterium]|nr:hypothetical protein [Candidatus Aminicenantes bacterium]
MIKKMLPGLAAALVAAALIGAPGDVRGQETIEASTAGVQPVSWDAWLAAKANAEKRDAEGDYVAALQYYLEYVRQAQGLNSPGRVAWGKNNAAYMIIKMYREDPTVDLTPAQKLLEEALDVPEASEECRDVLTRNLVYVRSCLGRRG